jgi:hypothetical protein
MNVASASKNAKREQHAATSSIPDVLPSGRRIVTHARHVGKKAQRCDLEKGTEKKALDAACVGRITFDRR